MGVREAAIGQPQQTQRELLDVNAAVNTAINSRTSGSWVPRWTRRRLQCAADTEAGIPNANGHQALEGTRMGPLRSTKALEHGSHETQRESLTGLLPGRGEEADTVLLGTPVVSATKWL